MAQRKYNPQPRQAIAIYEYLKKENLKLGVEVGVFWGETYFYLLDRFPNLKLIGIDLWEEITWGDKTDEGYRDYADFPLTDYYREIVKRAKKYKGRAIIRREDSVDSSKKVTDNSLDFVFIDGDHTYEGVKRDIEAWKPKIRKGGWLIGHDIHMAGVKKAINILIRDYKELDNFVWVSKIR